MKEKAGPEAVETFAGALESEDKGSWSRLLHGPIPASTTAPSISNLSGSVWIRKIMKNLAQKEAGRFY